MILAVPTIRLSFLNELIVEFAKPSHVIVKHMGRILSKTGKFDDFKRHGFYKKSNRFPFSFSESSFAVSARGAWMILPGMRVPDGDDADQVLL